MTTEVMTKAVAPERKAPVLQDAYARRVTYLRLSVTDRCDLRCVYCMAEHMRFLPKAEVLSLEELERVATTFIGQGVRKLRVTGGEPLVRRNIMWLFERLARHLATGALDELTLTTNATRLALYARALADCGVRRVNVSLDTLDAATFAHITRRGTWRRVMEGLEAAAAVGLKVKINAVALRGVNEDEFDALIAWCAARGFDLTLIEVMPMGDIGGCRMEQYLPLSLVRARLARRWTLEESDVTTGGPARYVHVRENGLRLGFITPLTRNFCAGCNRVRLTCTGRLYMCLGQEDSVDLRSPLRLARHARHALIEAIRVAIARKAKGHDFVIGRNGAPAVERHMSVTGG